MHKNWVKRINNIATTCSKMLGTHVKATTHSMSIYLNNNWACWRLSDEEMNNNFCPLNAERLGHKKTSKLSLSY